MLRILIVDDQKNICETLKIVLSSEPDFEIVGIAHDGETAIELAKKFSPDLMLVDLEMPVFNGLDLTGVLSQYFPHIKVIVLSMHDKEEYIQQALQKGAAGYLLKNTSAGDLKESIRFVARGYTQFSPGLFDKIVPFLGTEPAKKIDSSSLVPLNVEKPQLVSSLITQQPRIRKSWKHYVPYWLVANGLLWGLAIIYLLVKSPIYTSDWLVSLSSEQDLTTAKIDDRSSVATEELSSNNFNLVDPYRNYVSLLNKSEILASAARKLDMAQLEFGKPMVRRENNNSLIKLSIEGNSPEEARQKAIALQQTLQEKLEPKTINQTNPSLQTQVKKSEQALNNARQKLANFKAEMATNSQDDSEDLTAKLEYLRTQQADTKAQIKQTRSQAERLANSLGTTPQMARDNYRLHSDSSFAKYWSEYNRLNAELLKFEAIFQPQNPVLVNKQEEVKAVRQSLMQRGKTLLGRNISEDTLQQSSFGLEENNYNRGSLFKQIAALQSEVDFLTDKLNRLNLQVKELEKRENAFPQQMLTLSKLERDVTSAEKMHSLYLARSQPAKNKIADTYPEVKFTSQPTLATKPSSPNRQLVYGIGLMSSICVTVAIAFIWFNSKEKTFLATGKSNLRPLQRNLS